MIKTALFDVDGVLLDLFEANFKFFSDLMQKFKYNPPTREQFAPLFHRTMEDVIRILTETDDKEEINKIWLAGKERQIPYHTELLRTPEHLKETLAALKEKYTLGIVTSRTKDYIYLVPQLKELEEYFSIAVGCEDTEQHKPHPEPLLFAAEKLAVSPLECVYIGDVENDHLAAKAAGMKSVICSKQPVSGADANIPSFRLLPEAIASFQLVL